MPVYVIGQLTIHDRDRYQPYLDGFLPSFERHGGQLLATSAGAQTVLEGTWAGAATVVMQFPDRDAALAWYNDPDYQALCRHRHAAAAANLVLVDGVCGD